MSMGVNAGVLSSWALLVPARSDCCCCCCPVLRLWKSVMSLSPACAALLFEGLCAECGDCPLSLGEAPMMRICASNTASFAAGENHGSLLSTPVHAKHLTARSASLLLIACSPHCLTRCEMRTQSEGVTRHVKRMASR